MVQKSHSQPPFGCKKKMLQVNGNELPTSSGEFTGFLVAINSMSRVGSELIPFSQPPFRANGGAGKLETNPDFC